MAVLNDLKITLVADAKTLFDDLSITTGGFSSPSNGSDGVVARADGARDEPSAKIPKHKIFISHSLSSVMERTYNEH